MAEINFEKIAKKTKKEKDLCALIRKCIYSSNQDWSDEFVEILKRQIFVKDKNFEAKLSFVSAPCFQNVVSVQEAINTISEQKQKIEFVKKIKMFSNREIILTDKDVVDDYNIKYGSSFGMIYLKKQERYFFR